ncbi:hypothetical protein CLAFUW4_09720 [Fulvia fulva]|uniref:Uncharacterized protein n=1 Tax=Passalora fulva TaxID=5499 RepID=A0A9Q8UTT9_PASFU|nr:uncharacterized protein CLAFUR5_09813 [Fulvia fulva]KAK4613789.1 hypothetical protein CLAFUR4_09725 [Fulvia fulva]KAK4614759.1 hypothetical protein CLAFUR0_09716 [Fulvia fulva]UJO22226.1 hypothetical protein CLAFUR5_09813 [Fulvia fulva]WPV20639.1 hypothetical protein CLAFUW4_09720 [Fulvia fulva]WPV34754.1 hypothetical protein CLAFUW7_09721 [Fulvia fulva]
MTLVSRTWHALSIPYLLQNVEPGSHNHGQLVPFLGSMEILEMDHSGILIRQRTFLRLMTAKPELARHVHNLTWTFFWQDENEKGPTALDRETWNVFSRLENVTSPDLAQYTNVDACHDPLVRQNPPRMFPRVTSLRLEGWMHRRLVTAIMTSICPSKLRSLKLDGLNDEGLLPDGHSMVVQIERQYARDISRARPGDLSPFDDDMVQRQKLGSACSFSGPTWYPLRYLAGFRLDSLSTLDVQLSPLSGRDDRNYLTLFQGVADVLRTARQSLTFVRIAFGESPQHHGPISSGCGNARAGWVRYQPQCVAMASIFSLYVLPVLCDEHFPRLAKHDCEGFRLIKDLGGDPRNLERGDSIREYQQALLLPDVSIMAKACVDYRWIGQHGISDHHPHPESLGQVTNIFLSS